MLQRSNPQLQRRLQRSKRSRVVRACVHACLLSGWMREKDSGTAGPLDLATAGTALTGIARARRTAVGRPIDLQMIKTIKR